LARKSSRKKVRPAAQSRPRPDRESASDAPRNPSRRRFLRYGLYGAAGLAAGGAAWAVLDRTLGDRRPPNILLVVIDTLRADHLGCYGSTRRGVSPHIDALARESWLFRRALSQAPWTLPSVASLLTSQFPSVLGIREQISPIDPRFALLPALLRQAGYTSQAIVSVDMLTGRLGFARDFDGYDEDNYFGREGETSPQVFRKAAAYVRREHDRPFFLLVHTFDPHYNYILHRPYDYDPGYAGHLTSNYPIEKLWAELDDLSEDDVRYLRALYDSEITFSDAHLGYLLQELERAGKYDDTLIVVTADHGEEFRERGWIGHSISVHRELIHVPLIVRVPGGRPRVIEETVGLIDLAPTLLRQAGLKVPAGMEGQPLDLRPGARVEPRPVFSETHHQQLHRPGPKEPISFVSVVYGNRKLIQDGISGDRQAYDLVADPDERHDVYQEDGRQDRALAELLVRWLDHVEQKSTRGPGEDATKLLDPQQLERLRSLGYL